MDKRSELAELLTAKVTYSKASVGYFSKYLMYPGWTAEAYEIFQNRIDLDRREAQLFESTLAGIPKLHNDAVDALLNYYKSPA